MTPYQKSAEDMRERCARAVLPNENMGRGIITRRKAAKAIRALKVEE